jgi:hypothetical protein
MTIAWNDKPECRTFKNRLMPLVSEFIARHSMSPLDDVWCFAVDPQSGGRRFLTHFQNAQFLLKIRTIDAVAEVLVGLPGASLRWASYGWLSPSEVAQMPLPWAPEVCELISLSGRLQGVGWF